MGVLWLITVDLTIFLVLGPTPLAPLGTIVTFLCWRFRGDAAPSFPYKVVWGVYSSKVSNLHSDSPRMSQGPTLSSL